MVDELAQAATLAVFGLVIINLACEVGFSASVWPGAFESLLTVFLSPSRDFTPTSILAYLIQSNSICLQYLGYHKDQSVGYIVVEESVFLSQIN